MTSITSDNPNTREVIAPTLKKDIEKYGIRYDMPHSEAVRKLRDDLSAIMRSMGGHYYHNFPHGCLVHAYTKSLLDILSLNGVEREVAECGALLHDFGHCGSTYRQNVVAESSLSNEEYACCEIDPLVRDVLSTGYRLQLQGIVLGTSFGQNTRPVEDPLYRPYRPVTLCERVVALADVSVAFGEFSEFLRTATLLARENGMSSYEDVVTFILAESQLQFFDMVRGRLRALVELDSTETACFESRLDENNAKLVELIRNPYKLKAYNLAIAAAGVVVE
jgi:hypothetical protein